MKNALMSCSLFLVLAAGGAADVNHWSSHGPPGGVIVDLVFDPVESDTLYAVATTGLFRSLDGGETWTPLTRKLPDRRFFALAIDPADPAVLYSGTDIGIMGSVDGSATRSRLGSQRIDDQGPPGAGDGGQSQTLYAGTDHAIYRSLDGGRTWRIAARTTSSMSFFDGAAADHYRLDVISPSYMIGPYQLDPTYLGALFHLVLFRPITWAPLHGVNLVDVRDVACAIVDALASTGGQRILATGDNVPYVELFAAMNRIAGHDATPKLIPQRCFRLMPRLRFFGDFGKHYFNRPHFVEDPGLRDRRWDLASTVGDAVAWARRMELFTGTFDIARWLAKRYL